MSVKFTYSIQKKIIHFTQEINFAGSHLTSKEIFIIHAKHISKPDFILQSEINIIESMHNTNLEKTFTNISSLLELLEKTELQFHNIDFEKPLFNIFPDFITDFAKLQINCLYALENLFLPLVRNQLIDNKEIHIKCNGLYIPKLGDHLIIEDIVKMYNQYDYLKIKIGHLPFEYEINLLNSFINNSPKQLKLRLDANQKLSKDTLSLFSSKISKSRIEYFEEPYRGCHIAEKEVNIAIDESLEEVLFSSNIPSCVTAIVQKPSVRLAISGTIKLINSISKTKSIPIIISSCFEAYEGFYGLVILAEYANQKFSTGHGLDTHHYLKQDNLTQLVFNNNTISYRL